MPVKTHWTIKHSCGDVEERDLSSKPAHKRATLAAWLAKKDCTDCWRKSQGMEPRMSTEEWKAHKRAEEAEAAEQWATDNQMPPLVGTDGQVAWAARLRHQAMRGLYAWAVEEDNAAEGFDPAEETARSLDRAGWWIDNRDEITEPETLLELLHSAATDDGVICENTF
ncbi:hypothetical protein [Saccharopolyspora griseoalba]|uniref:Uncharacterized protein n=1 Tax=Saccharopolyspora griseoalba TaxID=1431848 RepID=A0ABW2LQY8_9PSEU